MAEKMTANMKKDELIKTLGLFLTGDMTGIDQNLIDRVKYTVNNYKPSKVSLKTLTDLMAEVSTAIKEAVKSSKTAKAPKKQPVEALKKPGKKPTAPKKPPVKEEEPVEEPEEKKPTKAPAPKKTVAPKKDSKYVMESCFPDTVEDEELGTLIRVHDKFHTYDELREFVEKGGELYFATYWTARLIKQFAYGKTWEVPCPASFPNDLDIMAVLLTCENIERVWAMSRYTEAMMNFDGKSLKPVMDLDPKTGEKCSIRVMNGMEYDIYMKEEDAK